jgi:hypothetical protein
MRRKNVDTSGKRSALGEIPSAKTPDFGTPKQPDSNLASSITCGISPMGFSEHGVSSRVFCLLLNQKRLPLAEVAGYADRS